MKRKVLFMFFAEQKKFWQLCLFLLRSLSLMTAALIKPQHLHVKKKFALFLINETKDMARRSKQDLPPQRAKFFVVWMLMEHIHLKRFLYSTTILSLMM